MAALRTRGEHCISTAAVTISLSYFFFLLFSSPILSGRKLDVYHTSTHDVVLVQIYNASLKCAARGLMKIQDAKVTQKIAICAPLHKFVGLYIG